MTPLAAPGQAAAMMEQAADYDPMAAEVNPNDNMHLVPCRWERSGWRYVQKDPAKIGFFNNPNRVNNFGSPPQRKFASSLNRDSFYKSANRSAFGASKGG